MTQLETGAKKSESSFDEFQCYPTLNAPELQLSPNGLFLAVAYNTSATAGGEVRFYEVNRDFGIISNFTFAEPLGGTINSLDFSPGTNYLYYISSYNNTTYIYRNDLVTASNQIVDSSSSLNDLSEIRHLADGKLHIAGYYPDALRVINNPDENYTFSSQTVLSNPAYALTYYMPMQKVIKSLPPNAEQHSVFASYFQG